MRGGGMVGRRSWHFVLGPIGGLGGRHGWGGGGTFMAFIVSSGRRLGWRHGWGEFQGIYSFVRQAAGWRHGWRDFQGISVLAPPDGLGEQAR